MTLDLKKQLNDLKNDPNSKSETARLRQIFAEVEAALFAGVSREKIVEVLQQQGFSMGLKSFDSALYRIRRKQKKQGVVSGNADNGPPLTGELVVYTDEPATGEVLEGASVKQDEWEDDELGDGNKPREESKMEKSTRESMEFVQASLSKGSIESALRRTPEKPQVRINDNK